MNLQNLNECKQLTLDLLQDLYTALEHAYWYPRSLYPV